MKCEHSDGPGRMHHVVEDPLHSRPATGCLAQLAYCFQDVSGGLQFPVLAARFCPSRLLLLRAILPLRLLLALVALLGPSHLQRCLASHTRTCCTRDGVRVAEHRGRQANEPLRQTSGAKRRSRRFCSQVLAGRTWKIFCGKASCTDGRPHGGQACDAGVPEQKVSMIGRQGFLLRFSHVLSHGDVVGCLSWTSQSRRPRYQHISSCDINSRLLD